MKTLLVVVLSGFILTQTANADGRNCCDRITADGKCICSHGSQCPEGEESEMCWRPIYLLSGPAAIVKGVGASVWCIGSMSGYLFSDVDSFGEGVTATLVWPFAVVADSIVSTLAYEVVGISHTLSFGFLVSDPPKRIENVEAPIYCVLSDSSSEPEAIVRGR